MGVKDTYENSLCYSYNFFVSLKLFQNKTWIKNKNTSGHHWQKFYSVRGMASACLKKFLKYFNACTEKWVVKQQCIVLFYS